MYSTLLIYVLTILAFLITSAAQLYINGTYSKYKVVENKKKISGQEAARKILDRNGLDNIHVVEVKGVLSDHYDPTSKVIRLSTDVFHGESIASVAVACHECGHAIQDKEDYSFMRIRHGIIPFVQFSSYAGYIAIVLGLFFGAIGYIGVGIFAEILVLLFQLVTLPVEFDASRRALQQIEETTLLDNDELSEGKTVLVAAALTYVASVLSTIMQLLRLVIMLGRRDDE